MRFVSSKNFTIDKPKELPIFTDDLIFNFLKIVLECPDEDWIDVIVENPAFLKYQEGTAENEEEIARYIVHFTPSNILENQKYKDWMRKFGLKTQHLIINEENKGYCSEAMHKMQHKLHLIHPNIFPFLGKNTNFTEHNPDANPLKKIGDKLKSIKENNEQSENAESKMSKTTEPNVFVVRCLFFKFVFYVKHVYNENPLFLI